MAFYDEPRFTRDSDVLLHPEDEERIVGESVKAWKFRSAPSILCRLAKTQGEEIVPVDILVGKTKRVDAIIDNAVNQPWSKGVRVATKKDIIEQKMSRGSDQDNVDGQEAEK